MIFFVIFIEEINPLETGDICDKIHNVRCSIFTNYYEKTCLQGSNHTSVLLLSVN